MNPKEGWKTRPIMCSQQYIDRENPFGGIVNSPEFSETSRITEWGWREGRFLRVVAPLCTPMISIWKPTALQVSKNIYIYIHYFCGFCRIIIIIIIYSMHWKAEIFCVFLGVINTLFFYWWKKLYRLWWWTYSWVDWFERGESNGSVSWRGNKLTDGSVLREIWRIDFSRFLFTFPSDVCCSHGGFLLSLRLTTDLSHFRYLFHLFLCNLLLISWLKKIFNTFLRAQCF